MNFITRVRTHDNADDTHKYSWIIRCVFKRCENSRSHEYGQAFLNRKPNTRGEIVIWNVK